MANNLPTVTGLPRDMQMFVQRVREALEGNGLDSAVTTRQLVAAGIAGFNTGSGVLTTTLGRVDPPRPPTNLAAVGAFSSIIVDWEGPAYVGHAYTEIWAAEQSVAQAAASEAPLLADAVLVGMNAGNNFAHQIGSSSTRYYWARNININGVAGAYNATDGVAATTGDDPEYLMEVLSESFGGTSEAPFFQIDAATTINGVSIPAGTYMKAAFIADATINRAKIQDAAIDSAKIASATIVAANIGDATITGAKIASATITNANIANATITNANIANAAVQAANIADATITGAKIGSATITNANIANATIETAKIANGAITNAQIFDAAITTAKIENAAISTAKIGNNMVTFPQFLQGAHTTTLLSTNTAETTLVTFTVYNSGAPAQLTATMNSSHRNNVPLTIANEYAQFNFKLYRGSNLLTGFLNQLVGGFNLSSTIITKLDNPGAGNHTYTLKVQNVGGNAARTMLFYPAIAYVELKK